MGSRLLIRQRQLRPANAGRRITTPLSAQKRLKDLENRVLKNAYFITSSGDENSKLRGVSQLHEGCSLDTEIFRILLKQPRNYKMFVALFLGDEDTSEVRILHCNIDDLHFREIGVVKKNVAMHAIKELNKDELQQLRGYGIAACFNNSFSMKWDEDSLLEEFANLKANNLAANQIAAKKNNAHTINLLEVKNTNV